MTTAGNLLLRQEEDKRRKKEIKGNGVVLYLPMLISGSIPLSSYIFRT
jgi:hypothetical protein